MFRIISRIISRETAFDQATLEVNWAIYCLIAVALVWGGFFVLVVDGWVPLTLQSAAGPITNPTFAGFAGFVGGVLAYGALVGVVGSLRVALLQMEQAEERRSTDAALANAMSELAKELRRRPEVSSSVTLALFAGGERKAEAHKAP